MYFWKQFFGVLLYHPLRIFISIFWFLLGKRKRARNRLGLLETHSPSRYSSWKRQHEVGIAQQITSREVPEDISFLVNACSYNSFDSPETTIASLKAQSYTNWFLHDEKEGFINEDLSRFDFLIWVRQGDTLPAHSLKRLAIAIQENPGANIVYSDHDYLLPNGRREYPYFKSDWNFALLLSCDYIFGLCAIRTTSLLFLATQFNIFSWKGRYQALIALGLQDEQKAFHITNILYHCHKSSTGPPEIELLQAHNAGQELFYDSLPTTPRNTAPTPEFSLINLPAPTEEPNITIVVPVKDRLDVLRPCIDSILAKTIYQNYNIIIVNNNSQRSDTLDYLQSISLDSRVKILQYPNKFNYAAINNLAIEQTSSDHVCLLNSDTEIIEPKWLDYLISWAVRPNVGAVGAKLLYRNNRIQHAGVIIGLGGLAGHGHRFLKNCDPGYFNKAHLPQYVSAITGACLVVEKKKYLDVGGMDSDNFTVAFNDVDFCLKLDAAGYNNVYEPRAVLYHYESKSRGKDIRGAKRQRYLRECEMLQKRWSTDSVVDRYYSPHLAPDREDFAIRTTVAPDSNPK